MAREFNSFENVLKMSIKYQIGYMERYLIELLSDIDDEKIAKVRVDFEESGAESQAVTRQTAEFFSKHSSGMDAGHTSLQTPLPFCLLNHL